MSREIVADCLAVIDGLAPVIDRIDGELRQHAKADPRVKTLTTLPGVGQFTALVMLAEIGVVPGGVKTLSALARELKVTERAVAERVRYQLRGSYSHYYRRMLAPTGSGRFSIGFSRSNIPARITYS